MEPFFAAGGAGYLADNATDSCQYCAYRVGDQFYEPLGFSFDNRWRDLGILIAFFGSNLVILFSAVRIIIRYRIPRQRLGIFRGDGEVRLLSADYLYRAGF